MPQQRLNISGLSFLAKEEGGLQLKPVRNQNGIPVISVGVTRYPDSRKVSMGDKPVSFEEAQHLFRLALEEYEECVYRTLGALPDSQFSALVSLCYDINTGHFKISSVVRDIRKGVSPEKLKQSFLLWARSPESRERRLREFELFLLD